MLPFVLKNHLIKRSRIIIQQVLVVRKIKVDDVWNTSHNGRGEMHTKSERKTALGKCS
jgi:hypothetical protein